MIIDYNEQSVFTKSIDIVDAGNMCLRCTASAAVDYLIFTKTLSGKTYLLKVGPVLADIPMLLHGFDINFKKMNYDIKKIEKECVQYINDSKKDIINVEEITINDGFAELPNIAQAFMESD